jgi:hypothetical protein
MGLDGIGKSMKQSVVKHASPDQASDMISIELFEKTLNDPADGIDSGDNGHAMVEGMLNCRRDWSQRHDDLDHVAHLCIISTVLIPDLVTHPRSSA